MGHTNTSACVEPVGQVARIILPYTLWFQQLNSVISLVQVPLSLKPSCWSAGLVWENLWSSWSMWTWKTHETPAPHLLFPRSRQKYPCLR